MTDKIPFGAADILIPKTDPAKWATIACDQFTSEPEYWQETEKIVENARSCLRITLPEVWLGEKNVKERIAGINRTMNEYIKDGIFEEYKDALVLVFRTLPDGRIRKGIVGKFRLADYSYEKTEKPMIRTTEGTVLSRIPPRVEIRKEAPLELPHIMVLIDDKKKQIIEEIDTTGLKVLYDFDLMLGGGHLKGFLLDGEAQKKVMDGLSELEKESDGMLFAVGDGNHSLATAKACAALNPDEEAQYALAELVNIHDDALDFEPIYRVMTGVNADDVINELKKTFRAETGRKVTYLAPGKTGVIYTEGLETKDLQDFIDGYVASHEGAAVDYIHGEDSLKNLASKDGTIGFLFGGIGKDELFPYVRANGPLPRKTFSMGEAKSKRYYMEARKIRK